MIDLLFLQEKFDSLTSIESHFKKTQKHIFIGAAVVTVLCLFLIQFNVNYVAPIMNVIMFSLFVVIIPKNKSRMWSLLFAVFSLSFIYDMFFNTAPPSYVNSFNYAYLYLIVISINWVKASFKYHRICETKIKWRETILFYLLLILALIVVMAVIALTEGYLIGRTLSIESQYISAGIFMLFCIPFITLAELNKIPILRYYGRRRIEITEGVVDIDYSEDTISSLEL